MKIKIKAVIDTNLFISGVFANDGLAKELQDSWVKGKFTLISSVSIIKEISRVLGYSRIKKHFHPKEKTRERLIKRIIRKAILTKDFIRINVILDDPSDNKFLSCAIEGKADYIISRDRHLRDLKEIQGIKIIGVTEFLGILDKQ